VTAPVTVIVPAFNAAGTLAETLDSLVAQDLDCWTAIIVDDGSSDGTVAVALDYERRDKRFSLVRQANAGVSAARNTGLAAAGSEWVLFLDSDDWISPDFFRKMLKAAAAQPRAGAIYCGYNRVKPDGTRLPQDWDENVGENPFRSFARGCPVVVHGVIVKRALVADVGGFDPALATCEDWDLWQKVARTGAKFAAVPDTMAFYRLREGSLSTKTVQMLRDGLTVTARAWRPDPRVAHPAPEYAQGRSSDQTDGSPGYFLCWCAGEYAAQGHDCTSLFDAIGPLPPIRDRADQLVDATMDGIMVGLALSPSDMVGAWAELDPRLSGFFRRLESALGRRGLARRMQEGLKVAMRNEQETVSPTTQTVAVDVRNFVGVPPQAGVDTVHLQFRLGGQDLGSTQIPVWGALSRQDVAMAALQSIGARKLLKHSGLLTQPGFLLNASVTGISSARQVARILKARTGGRKRALKATAARVVEQAIRRHIGATGTQASPSVSQAKALIATLESSARSDIGPTLNRIDRDAATREDTDPTLDPKAFFEQVFASEDPWNYTNDYESLKYEQTLALLPDRPIGKAMEVACAEGHFTRMLAPKVERLLAVDIAATAVARAKERCGDIGNIDYQEFNLIDDVFPQGLDLIVCSEVLYYLEDREKLEAVALRMRDALAPGGMLLMAHAFQLSDDPDKTGFDWGDDYGGQTISDVFEAVSGLRLDRALVTDLYRINLFSKPAAGAPTAKPVIERGSFAQPLPVDVERYVIWDGAIERRSDVSDRRTYKVPVLCYHRIAADGPAELSDYRVTPEDFAAQMKLLRRNGFHAITSADLVAHMESGKPFWGRPVMITFDDGYQDFHDNAWPILQRNDFTAEVFIVTGKVGQTSDWDLEYGAPSPLMDWPTIQALHAEGVKFGSHLVTHTSSDTLRPEALLREAATSRATLEARLGSPVESVAAPYGVYDDRLKYILTLCGYRAAFTTEDAQASIFNHPTSLPRVDVPGGMDLADFADSLGLELDEPEAARLEPAA